MRMVSVIVSFNDRTTSAFVSFTVQLISPGLLENSLSPLVSSLTGSFTFPTCICPVVSFKEDDEHFIVAIKMLVDVISLLHGSVWAKSNVAAVVQNTLQQKTPSTIS